MGTRERGSSKRSSISSSGYSDTPVKNGGMEATPDEQVGKLALKRQLGLFSGIALVVGTMIGSGIFVSPIGVLRQTDSVGMSLIIWLLCGILATMSALCYAELGTIIPMSGGERSYLNESFGAILAFLYSWMSALLIKPSSLAAITLTFAEYVVVPFFDEECGAPQLAVKLVAVVCIMLIAFINCVSVRAATNVQNIFTAAKIIALIIIIIVGMIKLGQGNTRYLDPKVSFIGSSPDVAAYGIAFYQGLWAYDGWNQLNYVTEELVDYKRNLPLAIIIGIPSVTILYLLVNISYFTVMSPQELLQSNAVAVTFGERTLGVVAWIMPLAVACSTFGAANGTIFTGARLTQVSAREGHLIRVLSMLHPEFITPFPSVVLTAILAIVMVIPNDFDTLINYFSFASWLFYGLCVAAVLYLRYKWPDAERPIKVPIILPIIVILAAVYLVIAPIIDEPTLEFLYAFLLILAGLFFYFPFVYYKRELGFMKYITIFFQLLVELVPPRGFSLDNDKKEDEKAIVNADEVQEIKDNGDYENPAFSNKE